MLVKKNDVLQHEPTGKLYKVIAADEDLFVTADYAYNKKESCWSTYYDRLGAYSNDGSILSLEELKLKKI